MFAYSGKEYTMRKRHILKVTNQGTVSTGKGVWCLRLVDYLPSFRPTQSQYEPLFYFVGCSCVVIRGGPGG